MDLFGSPSILRTPVWYSDTVRDEAPLPLTPGEYKITLGEGRDGRWTVQELKGATVVYTGIGPVEVVPFPRKGA